MPSNRVTQARHPYTLQSSRLAISVKEARKLLGLGAKNKTDDEIKFLITDCEQIARLSIRQYLVRKSGVVQ